MMNIGTCGRSVLALLVAAAAFGPLGCKSECEKAAEKYCKGMGIDGDACVGLKTLECEGGRR